MKSTLYYLTLFCSLFYQTSIAQTPCLTQPENDDPNLTGAHPAKIINAEQIFSGTTCCAVGYNDDPNQDIANVACDASSQDNAVWYRFYNGLDHTNFNAVVSPHTLKGLMTIEIYSGSATAASSTLACPTCFACGSGAQTIQANCLNENAYYWIKVATSKEHCVDFDISVNYPTSAYTNADDCIDAVVFPYGLASDTCNNLQPKCMTSTLSGACHENLVADSCLFNENPTVWIKIPLNGSKQFLFTSVNPHGSWNAVWSVFSGNDCQNLTPYPSPTGPCGASNTSSPIHSVNIDQGVEFVYVAITSDIWPIVGELNFDLCAYTASDCEVCLGELGDGCKPDASTIIEVIEREFEGPLEGPFYPNEKVKVNISYFYDASETGMDWLIGMVPNFGVGWDLVNYDYDVNGPGGSADWHEYGSDCAPEIQENVPTLCTYTDENGIFRLCNTLCETCPCTTPMKQNDPLPSGWFWTTNGSNAGCVNGSCKPGDLWGIGSTTSDIEFVMELRVKDYDIQQVDKAPDLSISFQTFSDGVAGCWEDPIGECFIDNKQMGPRWIGLKVPNFAINRYRNCDQTTTNDIIYLQTNQATLEQLRLKPIDNPHVLGEKDTIIRYNTAFDSHLTNTSDDIQVVKYVASAVINDTVFVELKDTILVNVYPKVVFLNSCEGNGSATCSLLYLDGICVTKFSNTTTPNVCDNNQVGYSAYMPFIAVEGNYSIYIAAESCEDAGGLSVALLDECDGQIVFCSSPCTSQDVELPSSLLIPGQDYVLVLQRCGEGQCKATIDVIGDPIYELPDTDFDFAGGIFYTNNVSTFNAFTPNGNNLLATTWTIQKEGETELTTINSSSSSLAYTFNAVGIYHITLLAATINCHTYQLAITKTIQVFNGVEDFGTMSLCTYELETFAGPATVNNDPNGIADPNGDGVLGWQKTADLKFGQNTSTVINSNGASYTQICNINLNQVELSPIDTLICSYEFPIEIYGNTIDDWAGQPKTYQVNKPGTCDTTVQIRILLISTSGTINLNGNSIVYDGNTYVPNSTSRTFQWYKDGVLYQETTTNSLDNFGPGNYTLQIVFVNGEKECVFVIPGSVLVTATEDTPNQGKLSIQPNPNKGSFYIHGLEQESTVKLLDIHGKTVGTYQVKPNQLIDMQHLPPAMYMIQLLHDGKLVSLKWIKQ